VRTAEVEAIETVGGVVTDLVEVAEMLPVRPDQAERVALILVRGERRGRRDSPRRGAAVSAVLA
jgi:hypothetical protein